MVEVSRRRQCTQVRLHPAVDSQNTRRKGGDLRSCVDLESRILDFGLSQLLKWESPREIEFCRELPKTLVGKINWKELENRELEKLKAAKEFPFDGYV